MRKVLLLLIVVAALPSQGQSLPGPLITWEHASFDFGDIVQGEKVEHTFKFTNTGSAPLVITNVQVTCGCTVPKGWARDPIPPGAESEITLAFNSAGKFGRVRKVVTIVSNASNAEGEKQIIFVANVLSRIPK